LFLEREIAGQVDEAAEVFVDVDRAGVVLGDQLLDPSYEVVTGRVLAGRRDGGDGRYRRTRLHEPTARKAADSATMS
jgi:hypothetical protein